MKCKRVIFVACRHFKTVILDCSVYLNIQYLPSWAPEVPFPTSRICSLFEVFTLTFSTPPLKTWLPMWHVVQQHVVCNSSNLCVWTSSQTQVSKCLCKYVQSVGGFEDKLVVKAKGSVFFPLPWLWSRAQQEPRGQISSASVFHSHVSTLFTRLSHELEGK